MISRKKTQWKKRIELTQFFYACLIKEINIPNLINDEMLDYSFSQDQKKVIKFFGENFYKIQKETAKFIKQSWSWSRMPITLQAILYTAYCENKALNLPKAITIDQALVTCQHYGQEQYKDFLNAILDKLL